MNSNQSNQTLSASDGTDCSVLFLDVDGVLNRCGKSHIRLEPDLLANLAFIVDQTDCRIVVSSTWRRYKDHLDELRSSLDELGIPIHGITPVSGYESRGEEIQAWMDERGDPK